MPVLILVITCLGGSSARSQQFGQSLYAGMKWRLIGPFRGGRALVVAGVPGQPNIYYFGAVGGGVWKTTDGGRVWKPLFDREPVASIGALALAPSDPNVIYVGTGEADMRSDISFGNGVYRSADAGATWQHVGLTDTRHIGCILVDPQNPDIVLVAALGHAYGPNQERGVFRTVDGGKTWQNVLYKDENTGAIDLARDPDNPRVIYATLWRSRRPPWSVYAPSGGPGSGLYRSVDRGVTWEQLTDHGLPSGELGRIGVALGGGPGGSRVYALIDAKEGGVYRSDDQGDSWQRVGTDPRIRGRTWYFGGIFVDPRNPDTVYVANTSLYRSSDGGRTWEAIKGAPGGDDYHCLWIDPADSQRMIVASDQGVTISVDYGRTWSTWYNQPTAQFYHVATDNGFAYHVYGSQQDSGTVAIASRSDSGSISFRDWHSVGGGEAGYIFPDPTSPDLIYTGGTGTLSHFSQSTHQNQNISPIIRGVGLKYRHTWTTALALSPQDPHIVYMGYQYLFKTGDGGMNWQMISPDLTRQGRSQQISGAEPGGKAAGGDIPAVLSSIAEVEKITDRGVIYTIAPSPVEPGEIWIGTDDGLIQLTRDGGKTWHDVTPPELSNWSKISLLDASHFDAGTAYAAIDRHRLDDYKPHIFRTHDYGRTWKELNAGIPVIAYLHVVREDPVRSRLLFAGTETGVYVSFDDGDAWQPLQLNLPTAPIHDLVIHENDLVAATHGRSFWILDDITPLRQINAEVASSEVHLFQPQPAFRLREPGFEGTPLPPETPTGENPPTGAIIDYYLKSKPASEVTLEVLDQAGRVIRKYSSADKPEPQEGPVDIPSYWLRPPLPLTKEAGMNRFVWDLRYSSLPALHHFHFLGQSFPRGPLVLPGKYEARLNVAGHTYSQPLTVNMDPRVTTSRADLAKQLALVMGIREAMAKAYEAELQIRGLRSQLEELQKRLTADAVAQSVREVAEALDRKAAALEGVAQQFSPSSSGLAGTSATLLSLAEMVDDSDHAPTAQAYAAFKEVRQELDTALAKWDELKSKDIPTLNTLMRRRNLPYVSLP